MNGGGRPRTVLLPLLALALLPSFARAGGRRVTEEELGASVTLPDATWTRVEVPEPGAVVRLYLSPERPRERLVLVRVPGGQERPLSAEHSAAAEEATGEPVRIDLRRLPAGEAERLEFREDGFRVVELWFRRAEDAFLAKIAAPEARWAVCGWSWPSRRTGRNAQIAFSNGSGPPATSSRSGSARCRGNGWRRPWSRRGRGSRA